MHARVASGGSKQKATIPMRGSRSRSCQHWPNSLGLFAYCNQAILRGSLRRNMIALSKDHDVAVRIEPSLERNFKMRLFHLTLLYVHIGSFILILHSPWTLSQ
jgi:hypothetical protein